MIPAMTEQFREFCVDTWRSWDHRRKVVNVVVLIFSLLAINELIGRSLR